LVVASKENGLEVTGEKTKYVVMSRDQNAGWSHSMKMVNSSFERVEQFKYLGTTLTNQNSIQEKLRADWSEGMLALIWCRILSSLLSKNLKFMIYRTIILPVLLYGCETWSLTLREEHRLRVFENRFWGDYLDLRGMR